MVDVFMFPGQGVQFVGMGKHLHDNFKAARLVFEEVDDALGISLSSLMWEGTLSELSLTENSQPAIMAVSVAVLMSLKEQGVAIDNIACVLGHSLGEYSALVAAGAFSVSDAARLLRIRGRAMQRAVPPGIGGMVALIGVDFRLAKKLVSEAFRDGDICQVANDNSHDQVVLSGTIDAVKRVASLAKDAYGKRSVLLRVSAPFHCKLMQPAAEVIAEALSSIEIRIPVIPIIPNVLAYTVMSQHDIRTSLIDQVIGVVRWRESIAYIANDFRAAVSPDVGTLVCDGDHTGGLRFFELGPGNVLTNLVKRMLPAAEVNTVGSSDTVRSVALILAK